MVDHVDFFVRDRLCIPVSIFDFHRFCRYSISAKTTTYTHRDDAKYRSNDNDNHGTNGPFVYQVDISIIGRIPL